MSYAIHAFIIDGFSESKYRRFIANVQSLYGIWNVVDEVPLGQETGTTIHDCWIQSEQYSQEEGVRVNISALKMSADIPWGFDYEWRLRFETGAGRSPVGLAVQLGSIIIAMESFDVSVVIDHDIAFEGESTEFRSKEALRKHVRRVIDVGFRGISASLKQRGIVDERGDLLILNKL